MLGLGDSLGHQLL